MDHTCLLRIVVQLCFTFYVVRSQDNPTQCERVDGQPSCVCKTTDGSYIGLTAIANTDEKPSIQITLDTFEYSLNPCYGINLGVPAGLCNKGDDSVGCQQATGSTNAWGIGKQSTEAIFMNSDGTYYVTYTDGQDNRRTKINLICDELVKNIEVTTEGDNGHALQYVFYLTSHHVCPYKNSGSSKGGVAIGIIGIVVILLSIAGVITYFIAGVVINMLAFEKTGLQMIPQKEFWFSLPFLIKDGVMFTLYPLIKLFKKDYESLS